MIRVFLRRAKTDPFGKGVNIFLGQSLNEICPVTALSNYLTRRPQRGQGPLFIHEDGSPLLKAQFVKKVKKALDNQNIDSSKYSGNSSNCSSGSWSSRPHDKMMGRWESSAYLLYARTPRETLAALSKRLVHPANQGESSMGRSETP